MTKRMTSHGSREVCGSSPSENILETDFQQMLEEAAEFRFAAMYFVKYTLAIQWTMLTACVLPTTRPRRRPDTLRTAITTAFFWPTSTTSRLPRVTPV